MGLPTMGDTIICNTWRASFFHDQSHVACHMSCHGKSHVTPHIAHWSHVMPHSVTRHTPSHFKLRLLLHHYATHHSNHSNFFHFYNISYEQRHVSQRHVSCRAVVRNSIIYCLTQGFSNTQRTISSLFLFSFTHPGG